MKILVVTTSDEYIHPGVVGGNQRFSEALVKNLKKYTTHKIVHLQIPLKEQPINQLLKSYLRNMSICTNNFDMVLTTKYPSYALRNQNHICLFNHRIREFYSQWDETKQQLPFYKQAAAHILRAGVQIIDGYYLKRCKNIYSQSKTIQQRLKKNNISSQVLYPPSTLHTHTGKYEYFLLPGRLDDRNKRVSLAIQAMKHMPKEARLIITGEGVDGKKLRKLAKKNTQIIFAGHVSDTQLTDLYANALAVVYPVRGEDYGLVTVEAFNSEKPVIICEDAGGPTELITHKKTGMIVQPTPKHLAKAMKYFLEDSTIAPKYGTAGKKSVAHITWKKYVHTILGGKL
jgi:glycosyltransferase involved in cell wall biosynthesis